MMMHKIENIQSDLSDLYKKYVDVREELGIEIKNMYVICNLYKKNI